MLYTFGLHTRMCLWVHMRHSPTLYALTQLVSTKHHPLFAFDSPLNHRLRALHATEIFYSVGLNFLLYISLRVIDHSIDLFLFFVHFRLDTAPFVGCSSCDSLSFRSIH